MREKLTSAVTWCTAIPLICNLIAMYNIDGSEQFKLVATTVVSLLAIFGILNNPNERGTF